MAIHALAVAMLGMLGGEATAAQLTLSCAATDDVRAVVSGPRWGERRVTASLTPRGNVLELWRSDRGTWTLIVTTPRRWSCIIAVGTDAPIEAGT